jgi:hypothetical protein
MKECVQPWKRMLGVKHPHFLSYHVALSGWEAEQSDMSVISSPSNDSGAGQV